MTATTEIVEWDDNGIPRIPTRHGKTKQVYYAQDGERLYTYFELAILCGITPARARSLILESGIRPENRNRGLVSFFRETKVKKFLQEHYG